MLTHKVRMTVRTKRQREALANALEVSRSIGDAAWGRFVTLLVYKAERAGGQVIRNPRNTSNLCSRCQRLTLTTIGDDFCCDHCGHTMDRDHNAALNILAPGVVTPGTAAASRLPRS